MFSYFITLCAYQSQSILGQLINGQVELTEAGRTAQECWLAIPKHSPGVQLDSHIVMPNHFHAILSMQSSTENMEDGDQKIKKTSQHVIPAKAGIQPLIPDPRSPIPDPRSLTTVISSFKSTATRQVNQVKNTPGAHLWQPSYHARIIKNDSALKRFRLYIQNNPALWLDDPLNPLGHRPAPFCPVPID